MEGSWMKWFVVEEGGACKWQGSVKVGIWGCLCQSLRMIPVGVWEELLTLGADMMVATFIFHAGCIPFSVRRARGVEGSRSSYWQNTEVFFFLKVI